MTTLSTQQIQCSRTLLPQSSNSGLPYTFSTPLGAVKPGSNLQMLTMLTGYPFNIWVESGKMWFNDLPQDLSARLRLEP